LLIKRIISKSSEPLLKEIAFSFLHLMNIVMTHWIALNRYFIQRKKLQNCKS